jgi:hypothetical protein
VKNGPTATTVLHIGAPPLPDERTVRLVSCKPQTGPGGTRQCHHRSNVIDISHHDGATTSSQAANKPVRDGVLPAAIGPVT